MLATSPIFPAPTASVQKPPTTRLVKPKCDGSECHLSWTAYKLHVALKDAALNLRWAADNIDAFLGDMRDMDALDRIEGDTVTTRWDYDWAVKLADVSEYTARYREAMENLEADMSEGQP